MSDFLKNLQNAVEKGEFNSDAAKKINEISELANKKMEGITSDEGVKTLEDKINKRLEESGIKTVSQEEAELFNKEYDEKMNKIMEEDIINSQLAILIDIENGVEASILDMMEFISETEERFADDIETKEMSEPLKALMEKITKIKNKFNKLNQ